MTADKAMLGFQDAGGGAVWQCGNGAKRLLPQSPLPVVSSSQNPMKFQSMAYKFVIQYIKKWHHFVIHTCDL